VGLLSLVWRKREVRDDELGGWLIWRELGGLRWILVKFWVKRDWRWSTLPCLGDAAVAIGNCLLREVS